MKIELTVPALERLIGGDSEIEVGLRKQIVAEFSKRHLREVAEQAAYQEAVEAAKQYVNEAAKESFGIENLATNHLWPTVGYRLKSLIETLVKESAQKAVDEGVAKIVEYQKRYWGEEINRKIQRAIDADIERLVSEGIQKRLEAASKTT